MLSRRIIRIKVLQCLYAHYNVEGSSINTTEKQLFHSINKSYELYILFFQLVLEIRKYAIDRIEIAKNKRIPTDEDLNPNIRFVNNRILLQLDNNEHLNKLIAEKKTSWSGFPELVKLLYNNLIASEIYQQYMEGEDEPNYSLDKKFLINVFKDVIASEENLYTTLEELSIYWNDESEFVISMVCKTINSFKKEQGEFARLLPVFKNDDDIDFTKNLLRKSILKGSEYRNLIKDFTLNWEVERIAFVDTLLIQLALTEIMEFPYIPVKVSMNEYIEISKFYSTNKSNIFLNGVLDKIVNHLKKEDKIKKYGRGLMGED